MPLAQCTLNAPLHPTVTCAALIKASFLLPSSAFWSGWELYQGIAVGLGSGGRGAGNLNATYLVHCQCAAAPRSHSHCCIACDWGIKPSPFTCILVGVRAIPEYSHRVE